MKGLLFILFSLFAFHFSLSRAQVADSVDVIDYDITLDLSQESPFHGEAVITMQLLRPCEPRFDFVGTIDSTVTVESAGNRRVLHLWFHAAGWVEEYGYGGFHFDNDMSYNLGVGFEADPHSVGRALFPCRDNFHDKATYTLRVTTKAGWTAECGGICQSATVDSVGREHSVWRIDHPTPTYLVSVSQSNWTRIYDTVSSLHGDYPLTVGFLNRDENAVRRAFAELDTVVPMFERCFGPYRWGRIGYIATEKGSMEHVNNIALDRRFINSMAERAQTTIAHELGHAWFGNLITCETEGDMWINEGGASFTSEVAMEAVHGRAWSDDYYQRNLETVLRTTHTTDHGYRALHDMPHDYTYGSTTYNKGWMVWHSLRGILGEEAFYSALNRLMDRCAFSTLNAYQLRDSLSLYTGVDLTDFFNFHVFSPGFVDYHVELVESEGPAVRIKAQGVGTTAVPNSGMVPVTFFGTDGTTMKGWFPVNATEGGGTLDVMYDVAWCVLDADLELSDAATVGNMTIPGYNSYESLPLQHIAFRSQEPVDVWVEHHWGTPDGTMPHTVVRTTDRYWMLRGAWNRTDAVKGYFRYVRTGYSSSSYAGLDAGFLRLAASVDSLVVLYRRNSNCGWQVLPSAREGNGNEGYLVADTLMPGEYTLAILDPNRPIGIDNIIMGSHSNEVTLFPNPIAPGQSFFIDLPIEVFTVSIFDAEGRLVWQKKDCHGGQEVAPSLTNGTYFVLIENNFLSLHAKLIQL